MTRPGGKQLERAILGEARRVLLEKGYTSLSMRRIASSVGCTATSIYLYFNNKDALIHRLIDEGMGALYTELQHSIEGVADSRERLQRLCEGYVDYGRRNPEYYEVMFMLHPERMERYPPEMYRRGRRNLDIFSLALNDSLAERQLSDHDLRMAATVIWTSLHGLVSLLLSRRIDVSLPSDELTSQAVEHAWLYLNHLQEA